MGLLGNLVLCCACRQYNRGTRMPKILHLCCFECRQHTRSYTQVQNLKQFFCAYRHYAKNKHRSKMCICCCTCRRYTQTYSESFRCVAIFVQNNNNNTPNTAQFNKWHTTLLNVSTPEGLSSGSSYKTFKSQHFFMFYPHTLKN